MDLDETLIHVRKFNITNKKLDKNIKTILFNYKGITMEILIRPGLDIFIDYIRTFCNLAIFTASTKHYADTVLNLVIPNAIINITNRKYRKDIKLYGVKCNKLPKSFFSKKRTFLDDEYFVFTVKDLDIFKYDINRIILVDNLHLNCILQPKNLIPIPSFNGQSGDIELGKLSMFIKNLDNEKDVREKLIQTFPNIYNNNLIFNKHSVFLEKDMIDNDTETEQKKDKKCSHNLSYSRLNNRRHTI